MLTGADYASGALSLPGGVGFSDDMIIMPTHCATQWDALSHCFLDGKMYNGFDATEISSQGARKNSIDKMARGIVGRGVLIDMPRFKRVPWLDPGYAISADDLEQAAERATGDHWKRRRAARPHRTHRALPRSQKLGRLRRR